MRPQSAKTGRLHSQTCRTKSTNQSASSIRIAEVTTDGKATRAMSRGVGIGSEIDGMENIMEITSDWIRDSKDRVTDSTAMPVGPAVQIIAATIGNGAGIQECGWRSAVMRSNIFTAWPAGYWTA
mmetsp:Transcript_10993/g.26979  ORF Transcript_10993/g.26979 Transcript_10993/m.26979 type:complete len:125 (-) Transcript_10993:341-715(-)